MDEPDAQRHVGAEALSGEEVPARGGSDLREHERRDDRGDDPEPHLREAELGVLRRDRDVGTCDEPGPASEHVAVREADDGRRARVDRLQHPVQPHRVLDVLVVREVDRGALPFDVGAGAEARPLAGEDDRARVADVSEGLGELGDQRGVERVPPLGTRERDPEDVAVSFDPERAHRAKHMVSAVPAEPI